MKTSNITKEELLEIIIFNDSLQGEIIFNEWEESTHQEKCINIGDAVLSAISDFRKEKQKLHQASLIRKQVNFDAPRSMLGCFHGIKPYNG
jgi:hypothetical protein